MDWLRYIREDGDNALREIYRKHRRRTLGWLRKQGVRDREIALELFQASVVILYDNVVSGKLKVLQADIGTYITAIVKNKLRQYERDQSKLYDISSFVDFYEEDGNSVQREKLYSVQEQALVQLGLPCKGVIEDFYYVGLSVKELAKKYGYGSVASAKNGKYKCMKRLQKIAMDIKSKME